MKCLSVIVFVSLLFCFQSVHCQQDTIIGNQVFHYSKNKKLYKEVGDYAENLKEGVWIVLDSANHTICEGEYEKGIKVGTWKYYFGDFFVSVNYQESLLPSSWELHYFTYNNCDNSQNANIKSFNSGEIEEEYWIKWVGTYNKKGKKQGEGYSFEGQIRGQGKYKKGYKTGEWIEADIKEGGGIIGFYVRGKKDGEWVQKFGYCDKNGNYKLTGAWFSVYKKGKYCGSRHEGYMNL